MNKYLIQLIVLISSFIFIGLIWFIYFKPASTTTLVWVSYLPLVNAILNTFSAVCISCGIFSVFQGNKKQHIFFMIGALLFSALFLVSYLFYHHFHGDTPFLAEGLVRYIYFFILISHIVLTLFALPLILISVGFALFQQYTSHKKISRWTFPIWLYVSVTGVMIYLLQILFNQT